MCFAQASSFQAALASYEQRCIPRTQIMQIRSALGERRYYETDSEASARQVKEQSQMSSEEFQDWLFTHPSTYRQTL